MFARVQGKRKDIGYHAKITGLTKIQTNEERPVR